MSTFLEKLKKGMKDENLSLKEESADKEIIREEIKPAIGNIGNIGGEKPEIVTAMAPVKKISEEKPKKNPPADGQKPKTKKIEVKELASEENGKNEKKLPMPTKKGWLEPEGQLTVDVYQTNSEIIIQSAIAGVKPEDFDVTIENDRVIIRGKREEVSEEGGKNYFYQECYWGRFSREIILPVEVDASRAKATLKNGVLIIRIPRIEREGKRKIAVTKE